MKKVIRKEDLYKNILINLSKKIEVKMFLLKYLCIPNPNSVFYKTLPSVFSGYTYENDDPRTGTYCTLVLHENDDSRIGRYLFRYWLLVIGISIKGRNMVCFVKKKEKI